MCACTQRPGGSAAAWDIERGEMAESREGTSYFKGWGESLVAVVVGNVFYLLASPLFPERWRHELFRPDLGLAIDFLFCVGVFALIRLLRRSPES